jgi:hypothetical protein
MVKKVSITDHIQPDSARSPPNMDPYLERYVKSQKQDVSSLRKDPLPQDRHRNQRDVDVDLLKPSDIRATYIAPRRNKIRSHRPQTVDKVSDLSSDGPVSTEEHLVEAGIQHLNLASTAGKVVIPRSVLVRLIEQTITLSGAAVHGEDVVIERYSPTWHRFARLLRTSDFHKISSLGEPKRFKPKAPIKRDSGLESDEVVLDQAGETDTAVPAGDVTLQKELPDSTTRNFTEREYIILALDARKKRVSKSRFQRLLDGSSDDVSPSADVLLKVESLDK